MWAEISAKDFCASVRDGTHDSPKPVESGRYLITSRHIIGGKIDLSNAYLISNEDFEAINKRSKVDRWDVLISMIGTVGEPCLVREDPEFAIKNIGLFKTKSELDGKWLYYYLTSPQAQALIRQHSRGTTQAYVPLGALRDFPVRVPNDEGVKRAITNVLGKLDDKIDLNRRINQTLEAMAQAIFKSWFVDFDPVKAKIAAKAALTPALSQREREEMVLRAAMRAISGKTDAELDALPPEHYQQLATTAALFPDEMVDSESGEIPRGWKLSTLGTICTAHEGLIQTGPFGSQLHAHDYCDEGVPVVMPQDLADKRIQTTKIARISENDAERLKRYRMMYGDILFSRRGDVTRHALVTQQEIGWLCGTGCLLVRPSTTSMISTYISCAFALPETIEWLIRHAVGATMPNLNTAILSELPILFPTHETVAAFEKYVSVLGNAKSSYVTETLTLATLRDTLLPKLLSGELAVSSLDACRDASA